MGSDTIIIGHDLGLKDDNLRRFLIASIFQDPGFRSFLEGQLTQGGVDIKTHEEFQAILQQFFANHLGGEGGAATEEQLNRLRDCAEAMRQHQSETLESIMAYSRQGRENPDTMFWPNPTRADGKSLKDILPVSGKVPLVDKTTRIGSAGSCFAYEIARNFQRRGFSYVVTEPEHDGSKGVLVDAYDPKNPMPRFSATWGIIFNTPSLRQLAERAFGTGRLPKIIVREGRPDAPLYTDPFREGVGFQSEAAFRADYENHTKAIREAFTQSEVFIATLGLNECWSFKYDGSVMSNNPRHNWVYALSKPRIMTVEENVEAVEDFLKLVRQHNPDFKLIISLSPIPLMATHRRDQHVVTANNHSKAVLRVAAEEIVSRNEGVYYFPSYEYVMHCATNPWEADERHVRAETVARIMEMFDLMFLKE